MASSGPNSPGTMSLDTSSGTIDWFNVNNAKESNNVYTNKGAVSGPADDYYSLEYSIKIAKSDGSIGSSNKSTEATLPTSDTYVSYGGSSDLWNETWSSSDINNSNFGVVFQVTSNKGFISHYLKATNFGFSIPTGAIIDGILVDIEQYATHTSTETTAYVDHIRITVYYTEATAGTTTGVQSMTGVNTITFGVEGGGPANPV
jgi:hemolysin activation/secretion protein